MMYKPCLVVLLVLLGVPLGRGGVRTPGYPCCVPVSHGYFTAYLGAAAASTGIIPLGDQVSGSVAFDNSHGKAALFYVNTNSDPSANMSVIVDYHTFTIYIIQPKASVQCSTTAVPFGYPGTCIPDDAVYLGPKTVGYSSHTALVDHYQIDGRQGGMEIQFQTTVTPDLCGLVTVAMWGEVTTGMEAIASLHFYNMTSGVPNPGVFDVPSFCPKPSTRDAKTSEN